MPLSRRTYSITCTCRACVTVGHISRIQSLQPASSIRDALALQECDQATHTLQGLDGLYR